MNKKANWPKCCSSTSKVHDNDDCGSTNTSNSNNYYNSNNSNSNNSSNSKQLMSLHDLHRSKNPLWASIKVFKRRRRRRTGNEIQDFNLSFLFEQPREEKTNFFRVSEGCLGHRVELRRPLILKPWALMRFTHESELTKKLYLPHSRWHCQSSSNLLLQLLYTGVSTSQSSKIEKYKPENCKPRLPCVTLSQM